MIWLGDERVLVREKTWGSPRRYEEWEEDFALLRGRACSYVVSFPV